MIYRTSSDLVRLAVIVFVVCRLTISVHGHYVGEHRARAVILIRVEENAETFKLVYMTKDVPRLGSLLSDPHGETITVEIALAVDVEFELNLLLSTPRLRCAMKSAYLPISGRQWHP